MIFQLEKTFPRLWSIDSGIIMVVTDLHGDWGAYQRYRDRFIDLHTSSKVDCLVLAGDLIHSDSPQITDKSLDIVIDVLKMQELFGDAVIYLCGNHELPHIYSFGLSKGKKEYTPAFEAALSQSLYRPQVTTLFHSLPFFVRTRAGVSITHAGASPTMSDFRTAAKIFNWDHRKYLAEAESLLADMDIEGMRRGYAKLSQVDSYDELARHYLAVNDKNNPRYNDLLRGFFATSNPDYQYLDSVLFTKCELAYGQIAYSSMLLDQLRNLSNMYTPQKVLVAGHMTVSGGHKIVAKRHLRLCSGQHATPREAGKYLLFDAQIQIEDISNTHPFLMMIIWILMWKK
ncbi:MAG: metallophosphoesterase [Chloroflexi bacterium]|nr:metallophosphoesterase [Chloroflexota bacterium]